MRNPVKIQRFARVFPQEMLCFGLHVYDFGPVLCAQLQLSWIVSNPSLDRAIGVPPDQILLNSSANRNFFDENLAAGIGEAEPITVLSACTLRGTFNWNIFFAVARQITDCQLGERSIFGRISLRVPRARS
jgi:hypothetical protein